MKAATVAVAVLAVVVLAGLGTVVLVRRLSPGLCRSTGHGTASEWPDQDVGPPDELAALRTQAIDLVHREDLLSAVPAAAGTDDPGTRLAQLDRRLTEIDADHVAAIMAPHRVEQTVADNHLALTAVRSAGGEGMVLDSQVTVREWGPAIIEGDAARTCFTGDHGLRRTPSAAFPDAGPDGYHRWTQLTFVELARAPGGPWRLLAAYTQSDG